MIALQISSKNDRHSQKINSPKMIALSTVKVIALLKGKAIALIRSAIAFITDI
jgi:hypothetical protein